MQMDTCVVRESVSLVPRKTIVIVFINIQYAFLYLENCPPGTFGTEDGPCIPCPLRTYQYEQGQVKCIPCDDGFITETEGALSSDECIDMSKISNLTLS